jgi:hypothetical protein
MTPYDPNQDNAPTLPLNNIPPFQIPNYNDTQHPRGGCGISALVLIVVSVLIIVSGFAIVLLIQKQLQNASPQATSTAVGNAPTSASATFTPTTDITCPASPQEAKSVPSNMSKFSLTLSSAFSAYYLPGEETRNNGIATRSLHLCWSRHPFTDLQQSIQQAIGASWAPNQGGFCAGSLACWSQSSQTEAGTTFAKYISLTHATTPTNGAILTLGIQTMEYSGSPSSSTTISLDPNDSAPDLDISAFPTITPLSGAFIAKPSSNLTYDNAQLYIVQNNCGRSSPSYTSESVDVSQTPTLCARTQRGHFVVIDFDTNNNSATIRWTLWPTIFW